MTSAKTLPLLLAPLLAGVPGPAALAATQTAVRVEISAADYPNAKCNDGTQASYYLRGAGPDGAISGRKWLVFLHGGGSCKSDESCAERWYDPSGDPDGLIGFHANMTTSTAPTNNFNSQGILDADGVDGLPVPGVNPFAGFNRIMVPYCSSDTWGGGNTSARPVNYAAYVGTTVNIDGANVTIRSLLIASIVISAVLAGILLHRLLRVARAWRSAATGARLHVRFVTLFSLAALAPAIIVAAFLGFTFSQGVDRWFSERVESTIENAANVGRAYVDLASGNVSGEVEAMAVDLNLAARGLVDDHERYLAFLEAQAERRNLTSAFVVNSRGDILARAGASLQQAPSRAAFTAANEGDVFVAFDDEHDQVVALYRLQAYPDAFLSVTRNVEPGLVTQLRTFRRSVADYRQARQQQNSLRGLFGLAYFSTALLVLLAAGWVGLTSASRVAEPIGRLVGAARRVASGDLQGQLTGRPSG